MDLSAIHASSRVVENEEISIGVAYTIESLISKRIVENTLEEILSFWLGVLTWSMYTCEFELSAPTGVEWTAEIAYRRRDPSLVVVRGRRLSDGLERIVEVLVEDHANARHLGDDVWCMLVDDENGDSIEWEDLPDTQRTFD